MWSLRNRAGHRTRRLIARCFHRAGRLTARYVRPEPSNPSRHAVQVGEGLIMLLGGAASLNGARPGSLEDLLPYQLVLAWSVMAVIGGACLLLAARAKTTGARLTLEQVGQSFVAAAGYSYWLGIELRHAEGGTQAGLAYLIIAVAATYRFLQVRVRTKELQRKATAPPTVFDYGEEDGYGDD